MGKAEFIDLPIIYLFTRIQKKWQRIKEDKLADRIMENEYELAMVVIEAIESRLG